MDIPERRADDFQFGVLVGSVNALTTEVNVLRNDVRLLRDQLSGGKGVITGLMIAAGGIGAGVAHAIAGIFPK